MKSQQPFMNLSFGVADISLRYNLYNQMLADSCIGNLYLLAQILLPLFSQKGLCHISKFKDSLGNLFSYLSIVR